MALENGDLEKNSALNGVLEKSDRVHIIGLLSDGGVHSHIDHIIGLAKIARKRGKKVFLHPITDGRDVSPTSSKKYIKKLENILDENIKIASISGRFYTMDRDNRWDRVEKGYRAIVEATPKTNLSPVEYIDSNYKKEIFDEFIEPVAFSEYEGMREGDGVIIANFRADRVREITKALGDRDFNDLRETISH